MRMHTDLYQHIILPFELDSNCISTVCLVFSFGSSVALDIALMVHSLTHACVTNHYGHYGVLSQYGIPYAAF